MTYEEALKILNEGWFLGRKATPADVVAAKAALDHYSRPNPVVGSVDDFIWLEG